MKLILVVLGFICAFFCADFFFGLKSPPKRDGNTFFYEGIVFDHGLHGDSIGLDCTKCHVGATSQRRAFMPSKSDCMDCHRLPLTENQGIERLDSTLEAASEFPWARRSSLPEHVFFHHGVHASAGVKCSDCHNARGNAAESYLQNKYGGENFSMEACLACHRQESFRERNLKPAPTYCGACHR